MGLSFTEAFSRLRLAAVPAVFAAVLAAGPTWAVELPGPLVDVNWLAANKDAVVLLDVRKKPEAFEAQGHIPGAVLVPWKDVRGKAVEDGTELIKMLPGPATFARLMKVSGVSGDSAVVITVDGLAPSDVFFGTRLYWQLKYFGHDKIAMLDGGNAAWAEAKRPLSKDKSAATAGNWKPTAERRELLATTADVAALVGAGGTDLVDVRTLDYHLGLEQKKDYVYQPGHIPGSKVVPNDLLLSHGKAKTFRDPGQLKATLAAMGVNLEAANVAYCNSGHLGSGLWFIMHELLGNKSAKLYDGSMHAWTKDQSRPVTRFRLN